MSRLKLSKNLLQMKFMQKTKDELEENQDAQLFSQHPDYLAKKQKYHFEPSYQYFENLKFGRTSYKGMNHEIEKLQEELACLSNGKSTSTVSAQPKQDDVEITDEQMADYYRQSRSKAGVSNINKNKRKRGD